MTLTEFVTIHQADIAILLLRIFIGPCFVVHALGKLGLVGPGNMAGFEGWLKSLGFPLPAVQARLAMLVELLGGVAVTFGVFYQPALFLLASTMGVAALKGHKGGGYLITNTPPGNEYALNLLVVCVAMALLGPGTYTLPYFFSLELN
jgi:putative oxidoreductase